MDVECDSCGMLHISMKASIRRQRPVEFAVMRRYPRPLRNYIARQTPGDPGLAVTVQWGTESTGDMLKTANY